MPPSETENVAAAPELVLMTAAAGDDQVVPSTDVVSTQPKNNSIPSKPTCDDAVGMKAEESKDEMIIYTPAATAIDPTSKTNAKNNGSNANGEVHFALTSTCDNKDNNDTPINTSPRRRVKKRRSDDFVYTDTKKDEKSSRAKETLPPTKKPVQRKRPHQCPSSDSILIDVPISVTADLGVALKRTRRKRIKRIQDWVASAPGMKQTGDVDKPPAKKKNKLAKTNNDGDNGEDSCSESDDDNEKDITLDYDDEDALGKTPKRNQYGSVLDYLEAKYVRGVMIADYDDREQAKIGSNDVQEEVDSEGDNSCYDDEDGFIDDSLMVEDVAGQVMASSTYGLTQIEEEARKRKQETKKGSGLDEDNEQPILESLGITDEKLDDTNIDEEKDSGFDDGFFVNLGDLEMAEGWSGDNVVISPTKKNKRTKKRTKVASKDDNPSKKKKKKVSMSSTPEKKKKSTPKTDSKSSSQKKGKKTPPAKQEDKQPKKKEQVAKQPKKLTPEKENAVRLRKLMKRKYNACVKMIKDMDSDQLPLKQRNKKTVKLSVTIPPGMSIGDEVTFANPNVPGKEVCVSKILIHSNLILIFSSSLVGPHECRSKVESSNSNESRHGEPHLRRKCSWSKGSIHKEG